MTLTRQEIIDIINKGQIVVLNCGGSYKVIATLSDVPADTSACNVSAPVFDDDDLNANAIGILGKYIKDTPEDGDVLIYDASENAFVFEPINVAGGGEVPLTFSAPLSRTSNTISLTALTNTNISSSAAIAWSKISKTGSSLSDFTNRSASDLNDGTLPDAIFPTTLPAASGANLTALNASVLASGTIPDGRFPATLPAASGVNLTSLNGSNISSGTVAVARLPILVGDSGSGGTAGIVPAPVTGDAAKFLRGDGSWQAISGSGTVTSVATGNGLQGGAITTTGTINLRLNVSGGLSSGLGAGTNELGIAAGGVTNAMLAGSIADTKLSQITTAGKVSTSALTGTLPTHTHTLAASLTDVTLTSPANGEFLKYNGSNWVNASAPSGGGSGTASSFKFIVAFTGSDPSAVSSLPSGWSSSISGNVITITHDAGKMPCSVTYLGYTTGNTRWNYRLPSAANPVYVDNANKTTQFKFTISTSIAGADSDQQAEINVIF